MVPIDGHEFGSFGHIWSYLSHLCYLKSPLTSLTHLELHSFHHLSPGPALAGSQGLSATPLLGVSPQRVGRGGLGLDRWHRRAGGGPGGRGTIGGAQHQGVEQVGTGWDIERMKLDEKLDEARTRKGMICEFDRLMMIDGWIWASSDGAERLAVHMNLRPYELFRISVLGAFCRPTRCLPGVSGVTMSLAFSGWAGVAPSYPTMASICSSS